MHHVTQDIGFLFAWKKLETEANIITLKRYKVKLIENKAEQNLKVEGLRQNFIVEWSISYAKYNGQQLGNP